MIYALKHCGYSLELPQLGNCNEYLEYMGCGMREYADSECPD